MKENRWVNKLQIIMRFSEFDVISAQKIFVKNAELSLTIADILAKSGSKEKEQMLADTVLVKSKRLIHMQNQLLKQFVKNPNAKI